MTLNAASTCRESTAVGGVEGTYEWVKLCEKVTACFRQFSRKLSFLSKRQKNSIVFVLLSLFLSACSITQSQFKLPEQIDFQGKSYQKVTHNQIDEMQQLLYLPSQSEKNPENWQQGILLFLDKNAANKSLEERLTLRQNAFAKQSRTKANLVIEQNELRSQVIYPPTARFPDVLLEVSRGRHLTCGFGQMQFSDKRSVPTNNLQSLSVYQGSLRELAQQFAKLAWQIGCH